MSYSELCTEERATIQVSLAQGLSIRKVAALLERSPATTSREIRRNGSSDGRYLASHAQQHRHDRRDGCRPMRKLLPGSPRFALIQHMLRQRLSPEQISGKLKHMNIPDLRDAYVCRET
ncbi:helix-turn-helix domain-containing protein, partial [Kushneria aurantia]|uniref:helix-turn-helix domain-containing protein n=1 Tax=Kushneria aurantia TaxID=504092 RepID=UPI0012EB9FA2